ncbi:MAG: hypothetical protein HYX72_10055 [Acidobacteria bacterium]|nr:hypothetical protein [Acidobacteriota bacterium]
MNLPSEVKASDYDKKTTVTFNQPVEIPGVGAQVLPAGTYVFRLVDSLSNRDIVQILNAEETRVYATILAIPNYRLKPTSKTVLTFKERSAGSPEALRAWFYPGNTWGQEFVYPKARAAEIAKEVQEPVLEMPTELAKEITVPVSPKDETPEPLKEAPIKAIQPSGEEVEIAQVIPPPTLPQTATLIPTIAFLGLLSLGAGLALVLKEKR